MLNPAQTEQQVKYVDVSVGGTTITNADKDVYFGTKIFTLPADFNMGISVCWNGTAWESCYVGFETSSNKIIFWSTSQRTLNANAAVRVYYI